MKAEIITIGDEILIGQIVDTNSAWIGQQLNDVGIFVHQITSVSDNKEHIKKALKEASTRVNVVLITGGLGPTKDDITKHTLAEYFNTSLVFNQEAYAIVEQLFKSRGREVSEINRQQAEVLANCEVLINQVGTASGMWVEDNGVIYVSMPGVPYEMKHLMTNKVIPKLVALGGSQFILHKTILTQGVGESYLAEMIADFEDELPPNFKLAYLPSPGSVRLRLTASGDEISVTNKMNELVATLSNQIQSYIYGYDDDKLEQVVGNLLNKKGYKIATAESCTGGYIAHMLTSVAGSSSYYMGSTVTYSYASKSDLLGVPADVILKQGAVSEEVVLSMVEGVKKLYKTECAIATSGVAGPGGGTPEKPVGTVWVAISTPKGTFAKKLLLGENRLRIIQVAGLNALNMLRRELI
jgi:nicotinamide-nucleotide amidase